MRLLAIYRLMAEGIIEDKIVKNHGNKRELTDSLLIGTGWTGN